MAKTSNFAGLSRMATIEPATVRDHSKLRSASIEASNQSSTSLVFNFYNEPPTSSQQLDAPSSQSRQPSSARWQQQQQHHNHDPGSPDYRHHNNSNSNNNNNNNNNYSNSNNNNHGGNPAGSPAIQLEAPCSLKPSASTSCLLTTEESSSSSTLVCIPTRASLTHEWKRLKTPNKCRECNLLVYFNGRECSFCGFVAHKKCVAILVIKCSGQQIWGSKCKQHQQQQPSSSSAKKGNKPVAQPIFGQSIADNGPKVVDFVKRFIYEIDTRGLTSRGIYRVSSIKSKVDRLCNYYDENISSLVDLSSFHANIIANALKMYLRQLPEPLLTHQLYANFIEIAKKYPKSKTGAGAASQANYFMTTKTKRSLVATQLETPNSSRQRDYDPMLVVELIEIIELLPPVNLKVIGLLMRHLKRVADMSDENQMSATNLSIIFGPTLLSADKNSSLAIVDNIHQARAVELMILWADKIFPQFDSYESRAVIELDFTELEQQQKAYERQQLQQQQQLEAAAKTKKTSTGHSKCNCPHHINSRDHHDTTSASHHHPHHHHHNLSNENDKNTTNQQQQQQQQDQWPKTRTELMELRRQFFTTLPTTQTDAVGTPSAGAPDLMEHPLAAAASANHQLSDRRATTATMMNRTGQQPQSKVSTDSAIGRQQPAGGGRANEQATRTSSLSGPSLPMIRVQSHDAGDSRRFLRRS